MLQSANKRFVFETAGCLLYLRYVTPTDIQDGGARGVMVIVVGNGHGDTISNPRRDWLHFT